MREYIERHLGVDAQEATRIRQHYWVRYGATLLGLMRHHQTDPRHFLWETHQFPDLRRMVDFDKKVIAMLRRLPGRKIIFSNAPRHYTEAILEITGLGQCFDAVYAVENVKFQPKPMLAGFRSLLRAEHLNPRRCIMVEDSLPNLISAKRLGMKTVWVSTGSRQSPCVDVKLGSVRELPQRCGRL
jgi:putative hydrolase of the HAD superfamily